MSKKKYENYDKLWKNSGRILGSRVNLQLYIVMKFSLSCPVRQLGIMLYNKSLEIVISLKNFCVSKTSVMIVYLEIIFFNYFNCILYYILPTNTFYHINNIMCFITISFPFYGK